jgi:hypothetical protein
MALARTNRINSASADSFGTGAYTSASFTPTANSLVVVWGYGIEESADAIEGTSFTVLDSIGSTFTSRVATTTSPNWGYGIRCWTSEAGASPAARTVSIDCGATNIHAYRLFIDDITGYDTGTPVAGAIVGSDADGNGAASVTLAATPTADDIIYGAAAIGLSAGSGAVTSGTGFTELLDANSAGWANWHLETVTGVTSTTVDWVDLSTAGTPLGATLAALIIKNAAAAGGSGRLVEGCLVNGLLLGSLTR